MDPTFALAIALLAFALGWLAAIHLVKTTDTTLMRRDMRTISGLRAELQRHIELLRAEKKRSAMLLGFVRKWRALAVKTGLSLVEQRKEEVFGRSIFRDPTLIALHMMKQQMQPLPKAVCWKCGEPATTRLGDSMYCTEHANGSVAP